LPEMIKGFMVSALLIQDSARLNIALVNRVGKGTRF